VLIAQDYTAKEFIGCQFIQRFSFGSS